MKKNTNNIYWYGGTACFILIILSLIYFAYSNSQVDNANTVYIPPEPKMIQYFNTSYDLVQVEIINANEKERYNDWLFKNDGTLISFSEYKYDSDNKVISKKSFKGDKSILEEISYNYDAKGRQKKVDIFKPKLGTKESIKAKFRGDILIEQEFRDRGVKTKTITYNYDLEKGILAN